MFRLFLCRCLVANPGAVCTPEKREIELASCTIATDTVCLACPNGTYVSSGQCRPCAFCGTGTKVVTRCRATRDTVCADVECPVLPAVNHAVVAVTTCAKYTQCALGTPVGAGSVASPQGCGFPAAQIVCGKYGAKASVTCDGGWVGGGSLGS